MKKRGKYKPRTRNFNENYFESIDSADKAYFLGLLYSDGCNTGKDIQLGLIDKEILEIFSKKLENKGKIYSYTKENHWSKKTAHILRLRSYKMCNDLSNQGCIPNKTHVTTFPNIEEKYYSHFIRGVFDGDGCIGVYKKGIQTKVHFSIIGNIHIIERIREIIAKECTIRTPPLQKSPRQKENIVTFVYSSMKDLRKIHEYLYKDCEDLFIGRKKEKFLEIDK